MAQTQRPQLTQQTRPGTGGFSEFSGEASRETEHGKSTSPVPQFLWIRFTSWEVNPPASPGCITHPSAALSEMPSGSILPASRSGGATEPEGAQRSGESHWEGAHGRQQPRRKAVAARGSPRVHPGVSPSGLWSRTCEMAQNTSPSGRSQSISKALNSLIIKAKTSFFSLTALQSGFKKHTLEKLFKSTYFSCSMNSRNFSIIGCFRPAFSSS